MFSFLKKKKEPGLQDMVLYAPVSGEAVELGQVPDQVFASKMMGEGVAFEFSGQTIAAPCDAEVTLIANTLHAVGLLADNGAEILIHIGLDTTELNGEGFEARVSVGQRVKRGDRLITFDRSFIEGKGYSLITPMVITNSSDFSVEVLKTAATFEEAQSPIIKLG
ncbi:PTS glucose transporter subunit IIA [Enterococcus florum]|uniref:PTS glucose transporter subunit IIA n=1 Tax=Enterococcus florum TaxID=2480627 RepID=A0A4P5PES2_9ENTE|nr:PTS glucose transporter subunit IIA [Enterococcus florum]GCF94841.1 PTS glucose transporter subunit IIA [Enterococcus florum]